MHVVYSLLSDHKLLIINIYKPQFKLVILFREIKDGALCNRRIFSENFKTLSLSDEIF
jgi:hypothetical protein